MKQIGKVFRIGLRQITKDGMLLVLLPAPYLVGLLFRLALPFANTITQDMFSFSIAPWYGLADGLLICLTPMFVAMVSAFLLLEERDEQIGAFYQITPVEGYAYIAARMGIPMLYALLSTGVAAAVFSLSGLSMGLVWASALVSTLQGMAAGMLLVSLAGNRVEGLALSKLMAIALCGLVVVWCIPVPYVWFGAFLPAFWVGKLVREGMQLFPFGMGILTGLVWIALFTRRFLRRV